MSFDLPFQCFEATSMHLALSASAKALQALTPDSLRVVEVFPGRGLMGIACIEYQDTTLGPYREVGVAWPVVSVESGLPWTRVPLLPLATTRVWPGFGWWVHQLPVTTELARDAGRSVWGYPKYLANIDFSWQGPQRNCVLSEGGANILRISSDTRLPALPQRLSQRTFTQMGSELFSTRMEIDGVGFGRFFTSQVEVTFGDHPKGRELAGLDADTSRALTVQWFPTWRAVLPAPSHV